MDFSGTLPRPMAEQRIAPGAVLASYTEAWLRGRRVVVFGNATSEFCHILLERGARLVHVYDQDLTRVAEAASRGTSRNVSFAPLGQAGVAVRDGAFDIGFIENLGEYTDTAEVLSRLRRALSPRGIAVVAAANREVSDRLSQWGIAEAKTEIGYYDLYDAIASGFEHVRMLGQAPFVGYAVAEFAPGTEPDVSFDASFLPSGAEEPEWFLAVASHHEVELDPFCVFQLPLTQLLGTPDDTGLALHLQEAEQRREAAEARVKQLEQELQRERSQARGEDPAVTELRKELERAKLWSEQLEARAEAADARADQVQAELERERAAAKKSAAVAATPSPKDAADVATSSELAQEFEQLERTLRERGEHVLQLERALRDAQRLGTELLAELEDARETPSAPSRIDGESLELLLKRNARLDADLTAARWTIQELEGRLELPLEGGEA